MSDPAILPTGGNRPLRRPDELVEAGLAPADRLAALERVAARYAIAITPAMADLVDPTDPDDPIARQFVPDEAELDHRPEELADPIGDHSHSPVKGIVHRYPDRVLLKPSHACPVYCRFCFRREMVGPGGEALTPAELAAAIGYIADHPEVWEVVITGGDPLMLSPRRLGELVRALSAVPHVAVIRFHSRVPVVDPGRIDAALVAALATDKAVWVAVHANHARELGDEQAAACRRLTQAGIPLIGQSVLLKGVNDDVATLSALLRRMVALRIKPYYLHHGDLAPGTQQFRTSIDEGQALVRALRGAVSGLCQPTYVLDIPGGHGKAPIGPDFLARDTAGHWLVTDFRGQSHRYPPPATEDKG
ncbi:lysine 2,3-aminomutase [Aliidongia dinghuensis]|uniref:Lysine 2,3-aminomutase n=1 Tax=Aliidongia dinghuensis TaxID=1867774 RepID=A0A8J2YTL8_9PROT|nr:lysine-2,3-aminomutase-like protein [Aliidongia dinghuensis]GGF13576.1 lysine 2,3-aminomutase [Aliidongia dinghuensis]